MGYTGTLQESRGSPQAGVGSVRGDRCHAAESCRGRFPCLASAPLPCLSHWAPALAVCVLVPKALVLKSRLHPSLASELKAR